MAESAGGTPGAGDGPGRGKPPDRPASQPDPAPRSPRAFDAASKDAGLPGRAGDPASRPTERATSEHVAAPRTPASTRATATATAPADTARSLLRRALRSGLDDVDRAVARTAFTLTPRPAGTVLSVRRGVAEVTGLHGVRADEVLRFEGGVLGIAFDIEPETVSVVLLGDPDRLAAGAEVHRTGRVLDVPVGPALRGRVLDPLGRPLDGRAPPDAADRSPIERDAPAILDRRPVRRPLQTGIKVVDAMFPIGRGQRELILGDRQTGKTAIALDAILEQGRESEHEGRPPVHCIYCAVGQRTSAVAKRIAMLEREGALAYTTVVVADAEAPPGLQYVAPFAATTIAEWSMHQGHDALIVYDDLTRHAWAYRELSLLLRRPPGREAYPGDIFFLHARLLERATQLRPELGGGSLTALPILETEAEDIAAYIPTNLISITDGQLFLSPRLFRKGVLPAIDIGRSVSRVGGKAQLRAYRALAARLRLAQSQFEELEVFARFGTQLEDETVRRLERGRRVRATLRQNDGEPLPVLAQIASFLAVDTGALDPVAVEDIGAVLTELQQHAAAALPDLAERIENDAELVDADRDAVKGLVERIVRELGERDGGAGAGGGKGGWVGGSGARRSGPGLSGPGRSGAARAEPSHPPSPHLPASRSTSTRPAPGQPPSRAPAEDQPDDPTDGAAGA
jgi:F-type H+-transporting ATPase subunit alpha